MSIKSKHTYDFKKIEANMQSFWKGKKIFTAKNHSSKPKKYILDMFPYPSGKGLHVGHLLGYYASDVIALQRRMQGYEVLHPMGFDAFGLPAEQHAINTGQHPATTVKENIKTYTQVLKATGLSFDWERSFSTTDPDYYRWTQWIFLQLFHSWYNKEENKAAPIETLIKLFSTQGNTTSTAVYYPHKFTATEWLNMNAAEQQEILTHYRLAYLSSTSVNWCPQLGTVLANDEVKDGRSERGGYPVERKQMLQWSLRMKPYADRLGKDLEKLDWPDAIKEIQRHWIGKSQGAMVTFDLADNLGQVKVFTTRLDTIFGTTFLALAPEHPLIQKIITHQEKIVDQKTTTLSLCPEVSLFLEVDTLNPIPESLHKIRLQKLKKHIEQLNNLSERERQQQHTHMSGCFTGCYALHPFTQKKIPIFVANYVLMHYGNGAVMGVPAHDQRDYAFAKHFNLPIVQVIEGGNIEKEAHEAREGKVINASFATGLSVSAAREEILRRLQHMQRGEASIQYRLHDPVFARQRYWGEPVPIYFKEGMPTSFSEKDLPLKLPNIATYKPTANGEPPLARAKNWHYEGNPLETSTMPAWAGSSWYFLRYMDPHNNQVFADRGALDYWQSVDLYVGGKEHATGHLIYARFFTKFLYDRGYLSVDEPFKKLFNQGMILGFSQLVYRIKDTNQFVSYGLRTQYETTPMYVDINLVNNGVLDREAFKAWRPDLADATFILEKGQYICGQLAEKMSKSRHNTIPPEPILEKYGADVLRLYILFLGPIQQDKPWSIQGMQGMVRFLKKVHFFFDMYQATISSHQEDVPSMLDALHRAIEQVQYGIDHFTFNTSISALMVLLNHMRTNPTQVSQKTLKDFLRLLALFAPHTAEYMWLLLGHKESVLHAGFPVYNPAYLQETTVQYPVSINGKVRAQIVCSPQANEQEVTQKALQEPNIQKRVGQKPIKKVIFVPKRMLNFVI